MRYPHPARAIMFDCLLENRMGEMVSAFRKSIANSQLKKTERQKEILTKWIGDQEFSRMDRKERDERLISMGAFSEQAEDIMMESRIFDVSAAISHFLDANLDQISLGGVPLPFDSYYVGFGKKACLALDEEADIRFEGAYVIKSNGDDRLYPEGLHIVLVCNDPGFGDNDQNTGDMLRGLTRFCHFFFEPHDEVLQVILRNPSNCDPSVLTHFMPIALAARIAVSSVLYVSQRNLDIEVGFQAGAPKKLVQIESNRMTDAMKAFGAK